MPLRTRALQFPICSSSRLFNQPDYLNLYACSNQPDYLDLYNAQHSTPAGTPHTVPNNSQFKCYDGMHNWNQIQPAPYDGAYKFPSVTSSNPTTGAPFVAGPAITSITERKHGHGEDHYCASCWLHNRYGRIHLRGDACWIQRVFHGRVGYASFDLHLHDPDSRPGRWFGRIPNGLIIY